MMDRGTFRIPPSVVSATERFKQEADPLRGFIRERVREVTWEAPFIPRTDFYTAFVVYSSANGFHQMAANRFYEQFISAIDYSVKPITVHGVLGYKGIELR